MAGLRPAGRARTRLERRYGAPPDVVWEYLTTREGFEQWWGPAGFVTEVKAIDIRIGGRIVYEMAAVDPEIRRYLEGQGTPLVTESVLSLRELVPGRRLVAATVIDFLPNLAPYELLIAVDLEPADGGTRLVVTLGAMHDAHWTEMAVKGWESQLERLAATLSGTRSA